MALCSNGTLVSIPLEWTITIDALWHHGCHQRNTLATVHVLLIRVVSRRLTLLRRRQWHLIVDMQNVRF